MSEVGLFLVSGTATVVSVPAMVKYGELSRLTPALPRAPLDWLPSSAPLMKKVRFDTIGPPRLAVTRLKPRLTLLPKSSSDSYPTAPANLEPPVRVEIEMTPDWAPPNAAEAAPVVTEASSKPLVPIETVLPPPVTKPPPRLPAPVGTPST